MHRKVCIYIYDKKPTLPARWCLASCIYFRPSRRGSNKYRIITEDSDSSEGASQMVYQEIYRKKSARDNKRGALTNRLTNNRYGRRCVGAINRYTHRPLGVNSGVDLCRDGMNFGS